MDSEPYLVDIRPAMGAIPGITEKMLLHAAPAITWEEIWGPKGGSAIGVALFEGRARIPEEAIRLLADGETILRSSP